MPTIQRFQLSLAADTPPRLDVFTDNKFDSFSTIRNVSDAIVVDESDQDCFSNSDSSSGHDPLIGKIICIPDDFDISKADPSRDDDCCVVVRQKHHDVPISLCASGRHVRERCTSLASQMTKSFQELGEETTRIQSQSRRESLLTLPDSLCIGWEDRFASKGSPTGKVDKMIPMPVKPLERLRKEDPLELPLLPTKLELSCQQERSS